MTIDRKTFISQIALGSGGLLMNQPEVSLKKGPIFNVPKEFSMIFMATRWGFIGSLESFCQSARDAGYDGIEVGIPGSKEEQDLLFKTAEDYDLKVGFLLSISEYNFQEHYTQYKKTIDQAVKLNPLFINCHSGRDYFSFEENRRLIDYSIQLSKSTGIEIYQETHRSRILFAAHITRRFIEEIPDLRLTLDISHWCNVHESLLQNQPENVNLALSRTDHVHARVGHREGPQVTDPRAPEWEQEVETHFSWWDEVVKQKIKDSRPLTITTEFGPPAYMPAVPYTGSPLANQWEINVHMMNLWKQRYS